MKKIYRKVDFNFLKVKNSQIKIKQFNFIKQITHKKKFKV